MGFGTRLKTLLKEKNMTIKELSEKTGVSINTLYSITKRDTRLPSDEVLYKISQALKVDVGDLLTFDEIESKISENINEMNESVTNIEAALFAFPELKNNYSDEEWQTIMQFMKFIKNTRTK